MELCTRIEEQLLDALQSKEGLASRGSRAVIAYCVEWLIFPVLHSCYFPADLVCISFATP